MGSGAAVQARRRQCQLVLQRTVIRDWAQRQHRVTHDELLNPGACHARSRYVPTSTRVPWNRGRIVGPKPPLKPKHIWALRTRLQFANRTRDLALFNLAVDSKLRGCDLVRLRVSDIHLGDAVRLRATVCQRKTGRPVPFGITEPTREALTAWLSARRLKVGDWLFPSRSRMGEHLTTRHYSRLVDRWVALIGLDPSAFGTHSLRRTKVSLVYKRTGNIRACQLLLGHTKLENTVRYLGIEVDDALILSEQTEI